MRPFVAVALTMLAAAGCAARQAPPERAEIPRELPRWATDKQTVRHELARDLLEQGNTTLALDIIRDLRKELGNEPQLDLLQGMAMRDEGLHAEADRLLSAALDKMPRNAEAHEAMCVLRSDQKMLDAALDACRRATQLDPRRASAWNNLGFLLLSDGDLAGALAAIQKAVDIAPNEPRYRNNLGLAQAANGQARDALRTFASTGPRAVAHYNVGAALERFGDTTEALVHYDQALKFDPQLEPARAAVARLASQHKEE